MSEISAEALDYLESVIDAKISNVTGRIERTSHRARVMRTDQDGTTWISIPGIDRQIPVDYTQVEVSDNMDVIATIENGQVSIDGSTSNPAMNREGVDSATAVASRNAVLMALGIDPASAKNLNVDSVVSKYVEAQLAKLDSAIIGTLKADYATIEVLESEYAHITNGEIDNAKIDQANVNGLNANYAHITNGEIDNAKIGYAKVDGLDAHTASIADAQIASATITEAQVQNLTSNYAHITNGEIDNAKIDQANVNGLNANYAHITNGEIDNAKIGYANVDGLDAHTASIADAQIANATITEAQVQNLTADLASIDTALIGKASVADLEAAEADISDLKASKADISYLEANYIDTNAIEARYTKTDLSNTDVAWISNGTIANAAITNEMVQSVSANKLTAGTIDASKINVTNLQAENINVKKINGQTVTGKSIADALEQHESDISDLDDKIDDQVEALNERIDGAIETFTGDAVPTLSNTPASVWDTAKLKDQHIGDVYYVVNPDIPQNGYCYRFTKSGSSYSWQLIKDSDVTAALQRLQTAEGKIGTIEQFDSDISAWKTDTDEELSSLKTSHTTLVTRVDKTLVESVQLWFTKADTTAPAKPTSAVSTNDISKGNVWNLAVPTYNSSYKNYFYCYQWKYSDGTYGWSSVTRDVAMGESQERARTAIADAATADGKAVTAQNTANANIKSSVQLWFTKANTTAPGKPTSVVSTNDASTGNAWNLAVPTYSASYPNYFYCYQQQKGDGTYQWTDVVFDRATTENQANSHSALSQLATKVETSVFNEVKQTVDENSSSITTLNTTTQQLRTDVDGKASQSDLASVSTLVNTVKQTADTNSASIRSLNTTTQTLRNDLDNLEIGGRNLLYDTSDLTKWAKTSKATVSEDILTCTNTDTSAFQRANGWFVPDKSDIMDREIVVSFDAKKGDSTALSTLVFQMFTTSAAPKSVKTGNINEGTRWYTNLAATSPKVTFENVNDINSSTWTRVSIKFIPSQVFNTSGYTEQAYLAMYVGISNTVGSAQFRKIKAEYGTIATDWTPAPEDVEASITELSTTTTSKFNEVEQTIDGINTSIGNLQTTVSQKADGSTVTTISNKVNAMSDTVDGHTSQITHVTRTVKAAEAGSGNMISNISDYWQIGSLSGSTYGYASNTGRLVPITAPNTGQVFKVNANDSYLVKVENKFDATTKIYVGVHEQNASGSHLKDSGWKLCSDGGYSFKTLEDTATVKLVFRSGDPDNVVTPSTLIDHIEDGSMTVIFIENTEADVSDLKVDYATFKQTVAEFESTVGSTYATKSDVGNVNLLARKAINPFNWTHFIANTTTMTGDGYSNRWEMVKTAGWEHCYLEVPVTAGTQYTFSLDYQVLKAFELYSSSRPFVFQICNAEPNTNADNYSNVIASVPIGNALMSSIARGSCTFTPTTSSIWFNVPGGYVKDGSTNVPIRFDKLKLEEGATATKWTPAPEDFADISSPVPYVIGTQTAATYAWTGNCPELTTLKEGQQITYVLPYSVAGSAISATYTTISSGATTNTTGAALTLTLADGSSTGQIPIWYGSGMSRLTSHYGYGAVITMTYRENAVMSGTYRIDKGWFVDAEYNSDNVYSRSITGGFYTGANGAKSYGLHMKDSHGRWTAISTIYGTGTNHVRYAGGLDPNEVLYNSTWYANGIVTTDNTSVAGDLWASNVLDFRHTVNCGTSLTARKPVYLIGTFGTDGLFYLDAEMYTQTEPTSANGKIYIYVGIAYSNYQLAMPDQKPLYQFSNGKFQEFSYSRMSNAETSIKNNADAIELRAKSSDVYTKTQTDGLISTEVTNRNAAITAKADEITSSVSATYATNEKVDGLKSLRFTMHRDNWTENQWAQYIVGKTDSWVPKTPTSASSDYAISDCTTLRMGDTFRVVGISTDKSVNHSITNEVTAVPASATANISAKVISIDDNASSVNGLTTRMTSAETKITQNETAISLRATKTEVTEAIDGIEIGGRNYAQNSQGPFGFQNGLPSGGQPGRGGTTNEFCYVPLSNKLNLDPGFEATVSFDLELTVGEANPVLHIYNSNWRGPMQFRKAENDFSTCDIAFTANVGDVITGRYSVTGYWGPRQSGVTVNQEWNALDFYTSYTTGNTFKLRNIKLEKGNKPTDWSPAPEDMATSAELKVANDAISSKVEKNGVISSINQTSETVKINANRIAIDGTTTFSNTTLSGYLSSNYDAKGAGETAAANAVKNIKVGGTNLLTGTSDTAEITRSVTNGQSSYTEGVSFTVPRKSGETDYVLSFDAKGSVAGMMATCYWYSPNTTTKAVNSGGVSGTSADGNSTLTLTTEWKRYWVHWTQSDTAATNKHLIVGRLVATNPTGTAYYRAIKMETGNMATDWTPAPEDLASVSDSIEYIAGTQTAATGSWTGITKDSTLATGKTIAYQLPYAGNGNASLQLKDSSGNNIGGNIPVYSMTTRVTTHYPAGSIIQMTFDGANWRTAGWYNTNNYDRTLHNNYVKAVEAVASGALACGTASGYKQVKASATFDLGYPILWAGGAWSANTQYANAYEAYPSINPATTATVEGIAANKMVYLKGTVSGNTFTCAASNFLTCNVPTAETSPVTLYIPLGIVANDSTSKVYFSTSKSLYAYVDGSFRQVNPTDIVATQQIYYRSSSSAKPTALPTSWITETGDKWAANNTTAANWTKKVTPISNGTGASVTKYLYLWTCEQRKRLDGTVKYTDILLDDTTTVIDGGKIITGSVSANAVSATSGTFATANIPNLDAAKITSGTIDASKITVTNISIGNVTNLQSTLDGKQAAGSYATSAQLTTEINQRKATYGSSSTAAGTQQKDATCANFELYTGAQVTVTFSNANTHATPTLNVNSTDAKTIKGYSGAALTEAEYKWAAGSTLTFTYDGSYWRMQDGGALQAKASAASSASSASSSASTASTKASEASTSASNAATSASNASTSASNAATSASTASSKATAAADSAASASSSASTASTKASEASTSASTASSKATAAANSATAAAASATAAAEVMGGYTILWNYDNFSTANNGEAYICAFDPATGTKSDANGWVKWNGTKRTITKQMANPNSVLPYNIPIFIVCRLSSATAATGTNYMVWYNSGWKYASMPTPSAVGGTWSWVEGTDIILGKFVEPGSELAFTECEIYNPPWSSKQVTTDTITARSAKAAADAAALSATNYIHADGSGINIYSSKSGEGSSNYYLRQTASGTSIYVNGYLKASYGGTEINLYGGSSSKGTYPMLNLSSSAVTLYQAANTYSQMTSSGLNIVLSGSSVAEFGSSARIGESSSVNIDISSTGIAFMNNGEKFGEISPTNGKFTIALVSDPEYDSNLYPAFSIIPHVTSTDNFYAITNGYHGTNSISTQSDMGGVAFNVATNDGLSWTAFMTTPLYTYSDSSWYFTGGIAAQGVGYFGHGLSVGYKASDSPKYAFVVGNETSTNTATDVFHIDYSGTIQTHPTVGGISWYQAITPANSAIYVGAPADSNWRPIFTFPTYSGGVWSMGNYNNENLILSHVASGATSNASASQISFEAPDGNTSKTIAKNSLAYKTSVSGAYYRTMVELKSGSKASGSVSANGGTNQTLTISPSSNYTSHFGVAEIATGNGWLVIRSFTRSGSNVILYVRNLATSAQSGTLSMTVNTVGYISNTITSS